MERHFRSRSATRIAAVSCSGPGTQGPFARNSPGQREPTPSWCSTGYPRALERSVVAETSAIEEIDYISNGYGKRTVVWRYDPVLITDATPAAWHIENFTRLAGALAASVGEVVVSFAQIYRKTRRNLDHAAQRTGNDWCDPGDAVKQDLLARLDDIARQNGLRLPLCATRPSAPARKGPGPAACARNPEISAGMRPVPTGAYTAMRSATRTGPDRPTKPMTRTP